MTLLEPVDVPVPDTAENDPRIGHLVGQALEKGDTPRAVLLGFPSDKGVERNGGRTGASTAPKAIREHLYKMTPSAEEPEAFIELVKNIQTPGDTHMTGDLESDQKTLGEVVSYYLDKQVVPIILGGGHETAYGHFLGYAESSIPTAILNMDAHTDVRPLKDGEAHSGSPFRQAMEHESGCCEAYMAAGLQPHAVATDHLQYIDEAGGKFMFRDETNITSLSGLLNMHESDHLMVTFDMDAVDQSQAPGVSAPCTNGLPVDLWLTAAYLAGRSERVSSFDISEVNPVYDRDDQTVRLGALTIWHFLLGLSQR